MRRLRTAERAALARLYHSIAEAEYASRDYVNRMQALRAQIEKEFPGIGLEPLHPLRLGEPPRPDQDDDDGEDAAE